MKFSPLRQQILTLALTGQLVEQRSTEPEVQQIGPAPDKVPFAIPEKWKWVRLEQVCSYIQRGKSPKYSEIKQLPVVAQKCNRWDGLHMELALFIAPETIASYQAERFLQQNDVLLNSTGTGTLGRVGMYDEALNPYGQAVADGYVTIRAAQSLIHPTLIKYALSSATFQSIILDAGTGTTKQQELALAKVKQLLIPLPPLEEQQRIVAVLDDLMARLDQMEQAYSELTGPMHDHFRNLMLQLAISGQLVPQLDSEPEVEQVGPAPASEEVPFASPAKWKWVQIGALLPFGRSPQVAPEQIPSNSWVLGLEEIESHGDLIYKSHNSSTVGSSKNAFRAGNVLYSKMRPYLNKVIIADADGFCSTELIVLDVSKAQAPLQVEFLLYFLRSPYFVEFATKHSHGQKPRLDLKVGQKALMPLPPIEEQRRIVARIEELFTASKLLDRLKEFSFE